MGDARVTVESRWSHGRVTVNGEVLFSERARVTVESRWNCGRGKGDRDKIPIRMIKIGHVHFNFQGWRNSSQCTFQFSGMEE